MDMHETLQNGKKPEVEITFSEDNTEAYLFLSPIDPEQVYTIELLKHYLSNAGITFGIDEVLLQEIASKRKYYEKYTVARGTKSVDGKDGWYEFFFNTEVSSGPKILQDGSVDYSPCGEIPSAVEGETIAIYHPATLPKDGKTVFRDVAVARKGKELAPLRGRGFLASEDNREYTARYTGKITYINNRLSIDKELTIEGDVSYTTTGDIRFASDIHVRGNILSGMTVVSERGGIIVDGYVEAATLNAKKNIVLKNGMQGNGKGRVICSDSVSGKFFEQTVIECDGDVSANAIMNCDIKSGQDVTVSGRFGIIIGGNVTALRNISAMIIGNYAQKETYICAGIEGDLFVLLAKCENSQRELQTEIEQILPEIKKLDTLLTTYDREDLKQRKLSLTREKIEKDSRINEVIKQKQELVEKMAKANAAKVTIDKVVYPGVVISINGMKVEVTEEIQKVEYARRGSGIISYTIEE